MKDYFRQQIASHPAFELKSPGPDELSAAIQVVEVLGKDVNNAKDYLFDHHHIDCRPMRNFELNGLRFSFAVYITKGDIDDLVVALIEFCV